MPAFRVALAQVANRMVATKTAGKVDQICSRATAAQSEVKGLSQTHKNPLLCWLVILLQQIMTL